MQFSSWIDLSLEGGNHPCDTLKAKDLVGSVVRRTCCSFLRFMKWVSFRIPFQEFSIRFMSTSPESCPRLSGIVPFMVLYDRSNTLSADKLPIDDGIEPQKELLERSRCCKCLSNPNDSGSSPVNELELRSSDSNLLLGLLEKPLKSP